MAGLVRPADTSRDPLSAGNLLYNILTRSYIGTRPPTVLGDITLASISKQKKLDAAVLAKLLLETVSADSLDKLVEIPIAKAAVLTFGRNNTRIVTTNTRGQYVPTGNTKWGTTWKRFAFHAKKGKHGALNKQIYTFVKYWYDNVIFPCRSTVLDLFCRDSDLRNFQYGSLLVFAAGHKETTVGKHSRIL